MAAAAGLSAARAAPSRSSSSSGNSGGGSKKPADALAFTEGLDLSPQQLAYIASLFAPTAAPEQRRGTAAMRRVLKEYRDWYKRKPQYVAPTTPAVAAPAAYGVSAAKPAAAAAGAAAAGAGANASGPEVKGTHHHPPSAAAAAALHHVLTDDEWPGPCYVALHPTNPLRWRVWVCGGQDSVFHGLPVQVDVRFPDAYPFKSFKLKLVRSALSATDQPPPNTTALDNRHECLQSLCCWGNERWSPAYTVITKIMPALAASAFVGTDLERANRNHTGEEGGGHEWNDGLTCVCDLPARISVKTAPDARRWLDAARADPHQPFECHYYTPLSVATRTELARVLCGIIVAPPSKAEDAASAAPASTPAPGGAGGSKGPPLSGTGPAGATATPAGLPWTHPLLPPELLPLVIAYCADHVPPGGVGVLRLKAGRHGVWPEYPAAAAVAVTAADALAAADATAK